MGSRLLVTVSSLRPVRTMKPAFEICGVTSRAGYQFVCAAGSKWLTTTRCDGALAVTSLR